MARIFYNLLLLALSPAAIPYWILRSCAKGHSWRSLCEALGSIPVSKDTTVRPPLWFHGVSVGEIQSTLPLLRRVRQALPGVPIYVSVGTPAGRALAEEKLAGIADGIFRAPLDLPWCVSRVFRRLRPRLLIVAETEIWPNYFFQAKRYGASVIIVNGRISDRSAPRYRAFRFFFRHVLACADMILAQSGTDRKRFLSAGASSAGTLEGGNLKYDFTVSGHGEKLATDLRRFLDEAAPSLLLVAGSTREGEETMLSPALRSIADREAGMLAVVAPRHPKRFDEAARALAATGLPVVRRTAIDESSPPRLPAILLLDSVGELATVYRSADLVFVGGSLNGWGGHNVLEPVLLGKPVIVGPTMQNFRRITADLLEHGGLVQVADAEDLADRLIEFAFDATQRTSVGHAGKARAESQRGASARAATSAARLYQAALTRCPPSILAAVILGPLSAIWNFAHRLRRIAYGSGILRIHRLSRPVISVGNLAVGGTGKTPAVAWLVEQLAAHGHISAVLTRGYGRKSRSGTVILRAATAADPQVAGDEPAMLARRFKGSAPLTVLAVGANRHASGKLVQDSADIEFLVLDDGFQHLRLERSLNIVLVDAWQPFSNGHTLPLGRLRESPASLRDADIVLITRTSPELDYTNLHGVLHRANPTLRVMHSRMRFSGLVDVHSGEPAEPSILQGERVAAFCGIGNPQSFFLQLQEAGCQIVLERAFPDHHRYSRHDLDGLSRSAAANGARAFVTTSKDAMNIVTPRELALPTYEFQISMEVEEAGDLLASVLALRPR
ncbi:MAG: tetraacyldisaccharide 4'-kinase [Bryobacterales bacterium]|nr:tetraacyldisaccharide 4'-kinase [Bryobacterales bacterium]